MPGPPKAQINYRILSVNEDDHSVIVRYWSDDTPEDDLAAEFEPDNSIKRGQDGKPIRCVTDCNISIWTVPTPSTAEILDYIEQRAPAAWFDVKAAVKDPSVNTDLQAALSGEIGKDKKSKLVR